MSRPLIQIETRRSGWAVVLRSGRVEYYDSNYNKVVGVFDYLSKWRLNTIMTIDAMDRSAVGDSSHVSTQTRV